MPQGCGKKALLALAAVFGFVTVPFAIFLIYAIATGGNLLWPVIVTVMLALPALFFLILGLRRPLEPAFRLTKDVERHVLHQAAINDGELTPARLALGSQLRIRQCRQALEALESLGVARSRVGDNGELRYTFPELRDGVVDDDEFMRRLREEDPRSVLDFDGAQREEIAQGRSSSSAAEKEEPQQEHSQKMAHRPKDPER